MHLTNYSINKQNKDYVHLSADEILKDNNGTKRTLSSLYETLKQQGVDVETIKQNIASTCSKTMQIFGPLIEHQVRKMTQDGTLKGKPF